MFHVKNERMGLGKTFHVKNKRMGLGKTFHVKKKIKNKLVGWIKCSMWKSAK